MTQEVFEIKSYPNKFRVKKINALELMALRTQIDFSNIEQNIKTYSYILEHLEVEISRVWSPVKEVGKDVFLPMGLEDNVDAMNELITWFLLNVIKKAFMKSEE